MIPSLELQKAVYTELSKGVYPIFEVQPSDTSKMPFITFSDLSRETNFTKDNQNRFTFSIILHGWAIGKSSIQSKQIEDFIYNTVMSLEMVSYKVEMIDLSMNTNVREDESKDRTVFHSVQQFEITISKRGEIE